MATSISLFLFVVRSPYFYFLRFFLLRPFVRGHPQISRSHFLFGTQPHVCAVCTRLFIFINWVKYISLFDTISHNTRLDDAEFCMGEPASVAYIVPALELSLCCPPIVVCARVPPKLRPEDSWPTVLETMNDKNVKYNNYNKHWCCRRR